jgi:DNA-binding NarL/FixJ family response regulator
MRAYATGLFGRTKTFAAAVFGPHDDARMGSPAARILLVEDEYFAAITTEAWLRDAGFEVVATAVTADEAVTLAHDLRPDVIIMDIRLLGPRDGIDAAIEIFRSTGIRSLFASANDDPGTRVRANEAQPWGWLSKPYVSTQLIVAVKNVLAERR